MTSYLEENQTLSNVLIFFVNGKKIEDPHVDPEWTLLYYLRSKLRLCGTKLTCGEGGCGACTVMVSKYDRMKNKEIHIPVNACLAPVCSMHGLAVTTVEGIGSTSSRLHPVQERIAKAHGSQCGFCTPGMVMSMYTLLRQTPKPNMKDLEETFQGNLCRCTGYRPIIEGFKTFTEEWEQIRNGNLVNGANGTNGACGMGDKCCKVQNGKKEETDTDERLFKSEEFASYHPSQEPIFPPELKISNKYDKQYLIIKGANVTWYRPTTFNDLLSLKQQYPDAKIVVGNTEVGVERKFKGMHYPVLIQPSAVKELSLIEETSKGVRIGASATLTEIGDFLKEQMKKQPEEKTRIFKSIVAMLNWFAGKQIRSVGTIGGNIMTGSPISDLLPIFMATKVELEVQHTKTGLRTVVLDNNFFTGYRKTIINPDEVLLAIHVPFTNKNQYFQAYKQARRREDDIAIVNAAVNVTFKPDSNIISYIGFVFGGMSFIPVAVFETEKYLKDKPWNKDTLKIACSLLEKNLPLDLSAPGGMIQYRKSLVLSLTTKAYIAISKQLKKNSIEVDIDENEISGGEGILDVIQQKSSQFFTVVPDTEEKLDAVAKPIVHTSAFKQATGEAVYCDDIPSFENELFLSFILSTKSHAKILSIDTSKAENVEGVYGFVSLDDIKEEKNIWKCTFRDEKIFYGDVVTSQGQIIAGVVAKDQRTAQKAAKLVKVEYEDIFPVILSIKDAIQHKSFYANPFKTIQRGGDLEDVFMRAPHIALAQCRVGGQEHFYFETQGVIAVPKKEDDEMELHIASQDPTFAQRLVAHALGVQENKISCKVKRLGGAFGGKETKSTMIALPTAIAARKFNRPIRCMLDRDEDMLMTGGRHSSYMKYKVAFDNDGKILGVDAEIYINAGYSDSSSKGVCERAITHFENAYYIPVCKISGFICKTNICSNTAFRGYGAPQAMFMAETMIQDIADTLGKDRLEISEVNLYKTGDLTPYNQLLENCTMDKCWKECIKMSQYHERKRYIETYNSQHRYKKRGISLLPTKYGIAFNELFLNQGGALVNVYLDGSVLVHHGGIEMGQGLYTKMIQVASRALEIPSDKIHTSSTSTDIVPNTSATAASVGSDLNGMAVLNACNVIKERLKPFKEANPEGTWEDWVKSAYFDRVSLSAQGHYKVPNMNYDWSTNKGVLFEYFTYGAACTDVEIDTLTGDHKVLRTDIVMDVGESLNPAIDIGQIEGAFMQGYGLYTLEELVYSPTGTMYTRGPGTYKIPGFGDIPSEFNVSLLRGVSNPRAVYSSKAIGEPPLFLAASTLFAIKAAIKTVRIENNKEPGFMLDAPATADKIRMACLDDITSKLKEPKRGTYVPWNIVV